MSSRRNIKSLYNNGFCKFDGTKFTITKISIGGVLRKEIIKMPRKAPVFAILTLFSASPLSSSIVINHTCTNPSQIPQSYLDSVRTLDIFFCHASIGNDIMNGMADLAEEDSGRYYINSANDIGATWFDDNDGIGHKSAGMNFHPDHKCATFNGYIRNDGFGTRVDIAFFKFCVVDFICYDWWGDIPADTVWYKYYRPTMESLEIDYPDIKFVWWTAPLMAANGPPYGNAAKDTFNVLAREYCTSNGKILFDIADIESHDTLNNPVIDGNGYEAMWDPYSSDGMHLSELGRKRIASAFWWLFAHIAGWEMGVEEESCNNQSQRLCLKQNCPNPFNSSTSIRYSVIRAGYVELKIYDLAGQLVKTLVNKEQKAGTYTIKWDGRDDNKNHLPSGIYFIKLSDNNLLETRKVIFVR